jgi:hypothetical protein
MTTEILDVFQVGLRRGAEALPFAPHKRYFYVEHPTEGWRVYLRSAVFLHPTNEHFNKQRFLVVKRTGARKSSATWEPPKGQMEWKDTPQGQGNLLQLLKENVLRETEEESHVTKITNLKHTGLVFQAQEKDYPENHYFQYHIFQGFITPEQIKQSFDMFEWIHDHPKAFARFKKDRKEKDAVAWFNPRDTRLNPRWCPDIAALYLRN